MMKIEVDRQNEVQVLKEMIKSAQTQLKQKEAEIGHLKKKLSYSEAQNLAARQLNNNKASLVSIQSGHSPN